MERILNENDVQFILTDKKDVSELENEIDDKMTSLSIYSDKFQLDLNILSLCPNLRNLMLVGKFSGFEYVHNLNYLDNMKLYLKDADYSEFDKLMTDKLKNLEICNTRKISDLSFIEKAKNLRKLYLCSLPSVTVLPKFNEIYALKIYELHKVENFNSLTDSEIQYLDLTLFADKISGTRIADTLMQMKYLKKVGFNVDRNGKREDIIENRLKKFGREDLIDKSYEISKYDYFAKL